MDVRERWRGGRAVGTAKNGLWYVSAIVGGLVVAYPLVALAARPISRGLVSAIHRAFEIPRIGLTLRNTVSLAIGSTLLALVLGTILALAIVRTAPRLQKYLSIFPLLPLIIPGPAYVIGWAFLFSSRTGYVNQLLRELPFLSSLRAGPIDIYTVTGIIVITGLNLTSLVYLYVLPGLRDLGKEMEMAAYASGAGSTRVLFTIILPLLKPSLIYAGVVSVVLSLGQITAPLLLGRTRGIDVISTEMLKTTQTFPIDFSLGAVLGIPIIVAAIATVALQRVILSRNRDRYVTRGGAIGQEASSQRSRWAAPFVVLYGIGTSVLPVLALTHVAFSRFWTGQFSTDFTSKNIENVFTNPAILQSVYNSLYTSVTAAAIALLIGFGAAWSLMGWSRAPFPVAAIWDWTANLPLAVPAAMFGFAILFSYGSEPFRGYNTVWIITLTYVILMIVHSVRSQHAGMLSMGKEFVEASYASGAGGIRTAAKIVFPLMRSSIATASIIMIVLLTHEFGASMMVRATSTQVMGTMLNDLWQNGSYSDVAALSLLMIAVTTVGVGLAYKIAGSRTAEFL